MRNTFTVIVVVFTMINNTYLTNDVVISKKPLEEENLKIKEEIIVEDEIIEEIIDEEPPVYDNLTYNELVEKINRSLSSTLSDKGSVFVEHTLAYGVDPYLAVAISLHETGCTWGCSYLVKQCNNVGGQKGGSSNQCGSYRKFNTLDEGIEGFIANLSKNYVAYGLTTPNTIGPKYAEDPAWSGKINNYINKIKNQ